MIPYDEATSGLATKYHSEIEELITVLLKASIVVFLFGFAVLTVFWFRGLVTGVGDSNLSILITSIISLLVLYATVDLIVGLTRASVVESEYNFEITFQHPVYDAGKISLAGISGITAIALSISATPTPIEIGRIGSLAVLRPIAYQLIISSFVVASVMFLIVGIYLTVGQVLFLKLNFNQIRSRLRNIE